MPGNGIDLDRIPGTNDRSLFFCKPTIRDRTAACKIGGLRILNFRDSLVEVRLFPTGNRGNVAMWDEIDDAWATGLS
jgi:hypothetical protein